MPLLDNQGTAVAISNGRSPHETREKEGRRKVEGASGEGTKGGRNGSARGVP